MNWETLQFTHISMSQIKMGEKTHAKSIALSKKRVNESLDVCVQACTHLFLCISVYLCVYKYNMEGMISVLKSYLHSNNWRNFINGFRKCKYYKPKINTLLI